MAEPLEPHREPPPPLPAASGARPGSATLSHRLLDGRLKLRHLTLVCALDDKGSLVRAAEALHVTQPVLTRSLRELEGILGARLFDRSARGMRPTVIGAAFVGHARAVLGQIRQAGDDVDDLVNARTGSVRVGTHLAGASLLLPKAIAQLKRRSPGVVVTVREATPDVLAEELLSGDLDLIVSRLQTAGIDPRLRTEALYREPIALVTRPGHPAQDLDHPQLADLVRYPWVVPVQQTELRRQLTELLADADLELPADRVESTSMMITRYLLLDGNAVAVLPRLIAEHDEGLAVLTTPLEPLRQPVGLLLVRDRWTTPAADLLLDELRSVGREIRALPED